MQQRTVEQSVPVPQGLEETVEVVRLAPRKVVQQPIVEENVDVVGLVPQEIEEQNGGGAYSSKFGGQ